MDAETAITMGVIMLAAFMLTATVYGVWLSFSPRYAPPEPPPTPPTVIGQECRAVREAWEIINVGFRNEEVQP